MVTITNFDLRPVHGGPHDGRMDTTTTANVMHITERPPVVMVRGGGSWLEDSEGRRYLDFIQGWAVNCLGHSHPVVVNALREQADRLINCSPAYHNEPMARLARLVAESSGLDRVFELPWFVRSDDEIDLTASQETLDADHYGLDDVK